jgi:hypothetical protein
MASREEFTAALAQMRDAPFFGLFVKTLSSRRDAVIRQCLLAPTVAEAEPLRMEARALSWLCDQIDINLRHTR